MPPGKRQEGVGALGHHAFAFVHGVDDMQFGAAVVGRLQFHQALRE